MTSVQPAVLALRRCRALQMGFIPGLKPEIRNLQDFGFLSSYLLYLRYLSGHDRSKDPDYYFPDFVMTLVTDKSANHSI